MVFKFLNRKKNKKTAHNASKAKEDHEKIVSEEAEEKREEKHIAEYFYEQAHQSLDTDKKIYYLEKSLEIDGSFVQSQSELLKQYNLKRKALIEEGKIDEAMEYLDKIESVMKQSKDSIRGF